MPEPTWTERLVPGRHGEVRVREYLPVGAVAGWIWTMAPVTAQNPNPTVLPMIVGGLVGFVLSLVVIFTSRKKVRPGLIFAYALWSSV